MGRPVERLQRIVDVRQRALDDAHAASVKAMGLREQAEGELRRLLENPPVRPSNTTAEELQLLVYAEHRHRSLVDKARKKVAAALEAEKAARAIELQRHRDVEAMERAVQRREEENALEQRRADEKELEETVRHFGAPERPRREPEAPKRRRGAATPPSEDDSSS